MFEISRRDLVLGSAGAALVFGLKGPVSFIGAAHAQRAADSLKYKVGDIEVFSLHEGSIERAVTEAMVKNASLDDVKKALTAAGIGPDKIENPFTVTAIRTGGKVVLFDTGFGGPDGKTVFVTQKEGRFIEAFRVDRPGREPCLQMPRMC